MKRLTTLLVAALIAMVFGGHLQAQQYQILLKIATGTDGGFITGGSTVVGHEGEIDVLSFKAGVLQKLLANFAGGGARGAFAEFKPLAIYKGLDLATPVLLVGCASGKHFPSATLTIAKLGGDIPQTFFQITLNDVLIASVNDDSETTTLNGAAVDSLVESLTLSYSKIHWTYTPQNADGNPGNPETAGFDVKSGRPL